MACPCARNSANLPTTVADPSLVLLGGHRRAEKNTVPSIPFLVLARPVLSLTLRLTSGLGTPKKLLVN